MMVDFISNFLSDIITAPLFWFTQLLDKSSQQSFYLAMVFLLILSNRILKPLFGSAGSDKVKKPRSAKDEKEG